MQKNKIILVVLFLTFSIDNFGQYPINKIDSVLKKAFQHNSFMGCVLLAKNDSIFFNKNYGYENIRTNEQLTNQTVFYLASLAKPITAAAIFHLSQNGQLKINDKITKHLDGFPEYEITISQLLSHSSGIGDLFELIKEYGDTTKKNANKDLLHIFKKYNPKLKSVPGTTWHYSDINYVLLACIIEKVSKSSFETYINKHFLNKCDSKLKIMPLDLPSNRIKNLAIGYNIDSLGKMNEARKYPENGYLKCISKMKGDGGFYGSIIDLYKWTEIIDDTSIIEHISIKNTYIPARFNDSSFIKTSWGSNVAYGWDTNINCSLGVNGIKGAQLIGYMGVIFKFPESDITIIILSNLETDQFWGISSKVYDCIESGK